MTPPTSTTAARTAPRTPPPTSTAGGWTGSWRQAEKGEGCGTDDPECSPCTETAQANVHRRHGLSRCPRDPQLLDLRRGLRAPGSHVRAEQLLEPARSICTRSPSGRRSAPTRSTRSRVRTRSRTRTRSSTLNPLGTSPEVRLDRSDLPAAQGQRQLGLLRVRRHRARLRGRLGDDLRPGPAGPEDALDLESAARTSRTSIRTTSSATSRASATSSPRPRTGPSRRSPGSARTAPCPSTLRASSAPARRTSRGWSTRSCAAPSGTAPRSS